jgi:hypothetical protein
LRRQEFVRRKWWSFAKCKRYSRCSFGRDSARLDIAMVGLDFQPVSNDLPVTIHRVWPIVSDLDSLIHLEALPKMIDYRLQDPFQFREVMQPPKTFQ